MPERVPEVIPQTPELQAAILRFLEQCRIRGGVDLYTIDMEILRIDIANALLDAMGLAQIPAPLAPPEADVEPMRAVVERLKIPFIVRARIVARDGFRCVKCQSVLGLEIDHIVPLARGGTDDETNLQTLCARCNRSKGARLEGE